jgi:hypothetical protein
MLGRSVGLVNIREISELKLYQTIIVLICHRRVYFSQNILIIIPVNMSRVLIRQSSPRSQGVCIGEGATELMFLFSFFSRE